MYINAKGLELKTTSTGNQTITGAAGGVRTGTAGADLFHSGAGETLVGGLGDDVYNLWDTTAKITEKAGEGTDTVYVKYWGGYQLGDNIENAVLQSDGGTWVTGNSLNNVLIAGKTRATLDGGAGDDVLVGGAGADVFKITAGNGSDAIYNFKPGWDAVSLKGYSFTSFNQLKAAATQIGSDVSIKLSATESLVLHDVQLSALGAADFALPIPQAADLNPGAKYQYGAARAQNVNGWTVFSNAWGAGGLTEGKDFTVNSAFSNNNMVKGTAFSWSFALNTDYSQPIKAYPEVMFGNGPMNPVRVNPTDTKLVLPVKVADVTSLTAAYDVTYAGNTGGFNVSYDIWLTSVANGDKSTLTNEVMVWVHKGDLSPYGELVGTYTNAEGQTAKIYHKGTYTAVIFDNDVPKGTLDVAGLLAKLGTLGIVGTNEYIGSIELGAEVVSGAGSLVINDLVLTVATKGADGVTTTKTVTGAGTTVSTSTPVVTTPPPVVTVPTTPPTLESLYKSGVEKIVGEDRQVLGSQTTTVTASKVTITKTDVVGKSLGYDVVTMDASGRTVSHYDGAGKLVTTDKIVTAANGAVTTSHFSPTGAFLGSEKVSTDAKGALATEHYDAKVAFTGLERSITDAKGVVTLEHYDSKFNFLGQERTLTDAKGVVTVERYDSKFNFLGQDRTLTNADGSVSVEHYSAKFAFLGSDVYKTVGTTTTIYHYDPKFALLGSESSTVDANGVTKTIAYDKAWKVIDTTYVGTDRNDVLAGSNTTTHFHGGGGSDTLKGGAGVDYFHFDSMVGQGDVDIITGFQTAQDKIVLDLSAYSAIGKAGALDAGAFVAGTKALDANDRILWDKATGSVWYDDDGTGAHAPVLLAKVTADGALTAAHFLAA